MSESKLHKCPKHKKEPEFEHYEDDEIGTDNYSYSCPIEDCKFFTSWTHSKESAEEMWNEMTGYYGAF